MMMYPHVRRSWQLCDELQPLLVDPYPKILKNKAKQQLKKE
jgi:hypothetical protein